MSFTMVNVGFVRAREALFELQRDAATPGPDTVARMRKYGTLRSTKKIAVKVRNGGHGSSWCRCCSRRCDRAVGNVWEVAYFFVFFLALPFSFLFPSSQQPHLHHYQRPAPVRPDLLLRRFGLYLISYCISCFESFS